MICGRGGLWVVGDLWLIVSGYWVVLGGVTLWWDVVGRCYVVLGGVRWTRWVLDGSRWIVWGFGESWVGRGWSLVVLGGAGGCWTVVSYRGVSWIGVGWW